MSTATSPVLDVTSPVSRPLFVHISPHGLIRSQNPELGRDLDTGGQVTYVLELSRALAKHGDCILFTRLIEDEGAKPPISEDYAQPEETICDGATIVRLRCGPRRYIRKEMLWDMLPEFVDNALEYILGLGRKPTIIHGHYADGAFVAQLLSDVLGLPMAFTGHSMGRTKMRSLLKKNTNFKSLNAQYKLRKRIEAEERALMSANLIIANSQTEINKQWRGLYDGFHALEDEFIPQALRPGVGIKKFVYEEGEEYPSIWKEIDKRLTEPHKPVILVLARLAKEKNITTMIETFGESPQLQEQCNLVIVCGQRTDPLSLPPPQRELLTQMLLLIEKYDLEGKVSRPRSHKRSDVPAIFALPAHRGGVFANIATREPFGLTLIEAAVNGAPLIATKNDAGPEIVQSLQNGIAVNPTDKKEIEHGILQLIMPQYRQRWEQFHENSLRNSPQYSWDGHVERYVGMVESIQCVPGASVLDNQKPFALEDDGVLIITDIDNTLLGPSHEAKRGFKKLVSIIRANPKFKLALATGRSIEKAVTYIYEHDPKLVQECLFIISSVGSEIHYLSKAAQSRVAQGKNLNIRPEVVGKYFVLDDVYAEHVSYRFKKNEIIEFIDSEWPELQMQGYETGHAPSEQRNFKVSYVIRDDRLTRHHRSSMSEDGDLRSSFQSAFSSISGNPRRGRVREDSFDNPSGGTGSETERKDFESESEQPELMVDKLGEPNWAPQLGQKGFSSMSLYSLANQSIGNGMSTASSFGSTRNLSGQKLIGPNSTLTGSNLVQYRGENAKLNKYLHRKVPELLKSELRSNGFICDVIDSHGKYVDILPIRATKGKAIRYLMARHNIRFGQIVTCGDSGNDLDMLQGNTKAIVVANRDPELKSFLNSQQNDDCVYYARKKYAHGVIDGLIHYGFLAPEEADNTDTVPAA